MIHPDFFWRSPVKKIWVYICDRWEVPIICWSSFLYCFCCVDYYTHFFRENILSNFQSEWMDRKFKKIFRHRIWYYVGIDRYMVCLEMKMRNVSRRFWDLCFWAIEINRYFCKKLLILIPTTNGQRFF